MKNKSVLSKVISIIFVLIYWSLGLFTLLTITVNTKNDISRVILGKYEITNLSWFLGMVPAIFIIFYLIFLLFKQSRLKTFVRLLATATLFVYIYLAYILGYLPTYLIIGMIFSALTILKLKNFQFKP